MKYAFLGLGSMAKAIIKGMIDSGIPAADILGYNRTAARAAAIKAELGITILSSMDGLKAANIIVLATTPKSFNEVLPKLGEIIDSSMPLISIAAGKSISSIQQLLGKNCPVIRVMPNINANVCASTTGYACSKEVNGAQTALFTRAFGAIGETIEIAESEFDVFAAIAGCAPAFAYMYIDALARAGVRYGLNKQKAVDIAASCVLGSAKMVSESRQHPYQLIDRVTTPGGTTIEGVMALQANGFEHAVHEAVRATIEKEELLSK